ncbi:hypothetical protein [Chelativorans intermedius]|uniref:Uncharacterized protein n=1 Tax=Chelativorans intermedius TaxID=515947 RepID=A0ABV6DB15_9HYPH|nr:hypothetical protein [Chelativorans intermedius]MCT9000216.1 hypothetical protein [Chelativorans intermedius]
MCAFQDAIGADDVRVMPRQDAETVLAADTPKARNMRQKLKKKASDMSEKILALTPPRGPCQPA